MMLIEQCAVLLDGADRGLAPSELLEGTAPPVVPTTGTPHAIASTAGSEKPSYSDGTHATSASAYSSTIRSVVTPCTNSTAPSRPSRSISAGIELLPLGLPITTRWAS